MKEHSILSLIYPDREIYIKEFEFPPGSISIRASCEVPVGGYVKNTIPYVTAENYVRCFSQSSYLLAHHVIKNKVIKTDIEEHSFLTAMESFELYYRSLSMVFNQRISKGDVFEMEFTLKHFKEIRRTKEYCTLTFSSKKIIKGEMSFVFMK